MAAQHEAASRVLRASVFGILGAAVRVRPIIYRTPGPSPVDFDAWRHWEGLARSFGLDGLELLLVVELARRGGSLSRADASEALAVEASELSRLINRAEEDALVVRASGADRRCVSLELLERGWDVADEVLGVDGGAAVYEGIVSGAGLPGGELATRCLVFNRQLRKVRRDCSLTFSQAACLTAATQLSLRPGDPSAPTQIERLTGIPRTTARTALSCLAARGFFS